MASSWVARHPWILFDSWMYWKYRCLTPKSGEKRPKKTRAETGRKMTTTWATQLGKTQMDGIGRPKGLTEAGHFLFFSIQEIRKKMTPKHGQRSTCSLKQSFLFQKFPESQGENVPKMPKKSHFPIVFILQKMQIIQKKWIMEKL